MVKSVVAQGGLRLRHNFERRTFLDLWHSLGVIQRFAHIFELALNFTIFHIYDDFYNAFASSGGLDEEM